MTTGKNDDVRPVKKVCYNLYAAFQDKQLACGRRTKKKVRRRHKIQRYKKKGVKCHDALTKKIHTGRKRREKHARI